MTCVSTINWLSETLGKHDGGGEKPVKVFMSELEYYLCLRCCLN